MSFVWVSVIFVIGIIVAIVLIIDLSKDDHELQILNARNKDAEEFYNG